jgi:hypothetical protein
MNLKSCITIFVVERYFSRREQVLNKSTIGMWPITRKEYLSGAEIEEQTKTTWRKIILFEEGVVVSFQHQITQSKYIIVFLWQYTFLVIGHIPMVLLFKTCSLREKYIYPLKKYLQTYLMILTLLANCGKSTVNELKVVHHNIRGWKIFFTKRTSTLVI